MTRIKVKNVTSAEAFPYQEALRPVYHGIFPNEAVAQIVLPHLTGIKIMLNYGATQNDINATYGAYAKGFATSNKAYNEGTDTPGLAWARGSSPTVKTLGTQITAVESYADRVHAALVAANAKLVAAGLPAVEIPASGDMGPSGLKD